MSNSFYNHGAFPSTGSAATSASMRAELDLVAAGFDKMPTLAGNANKFIVVNSTGTGLTQTDVLPAFTVTDTDFTVQDDGDNTRKFKFNAGSITTGNTRVYVMPDLDTTLVGTNVTQTLTNKTLTAPVIATIVNTGTLTLPTSTDTLVGRNTTDTLTNKTLTNPVIGTIVNTGTLTLPTSTDTLVGRQTTDTLTNKTISGASNTLSNIANGSLSNSSVVIGSSTLSLGGTLTTLAGVTISGASNTLSNIANASLTNSSVTINGSSVALGSSITVTASTTNALTVSTGLQLDSGTTFNGGAARTISIDSTVATLSGSQTLSNKTISGSSNTLSNIGNSSLTNSSITIGSSTISLGSTAATISGLTSLSSTGLVMTANAVSSTAISAIAQSAGTVTVTAAGHGLTSGDLVSIDGVADYTYCGLVTVNVTNANVFTYSRTTTNASSSGGYVTELQGTWASYSGGTGPSYKGGPLVIEASSQMPALRVTQAGNGYAFIVEDATNPDTSAFIISNAGDLTINTNKFTVAAASGNTVIAGTTSLNGNVTFATDATYDIGASGATRPRDLFLSRNLTVGGTLTLAGGVNLNGNVTIGDASTDTLTINSTVTSNLIFTDNTYDIGASGATRPRNLYLAGNAVIAGSTTLSGGTANGVMYLNGSKVVTSGSAFTFDGANILTLFRTTSTEANEPTIKFSNLTFAGQNPGVVKSSNGGLALDIQSGSDSTYQLRSRIYVEGGAANTISFQASSNNGSTYDTRMALTNTGLGVGITPAAKLDVSNGASPASRLRVGVGAGAANTLYSTLAAGDYVSFETNGSEVGRFASTGQFGIGETSPQTYGKLVVRNDTASGAGSGGASTIWLLNANATANNASTIFFGDNAAAAAGAINFVNTNHTTDYGQISFDTNGVNGYGTRLTIDSSGALGVATTPAAWGIYFRPIQLGDKGGYIAGSTNSYSGNSHLAVGNNGYFNVAGSNWVATATDAGGATQFYQVAGTLRFNVSGPVTAGSNISFTEIANISSGGLNFPTVGSGNGNISYDGSTFTIVSNSSSAPLVFSTNSTERTRISSAGNWTVGTSSLGAAGDPRVSVYSKGNYYWGSSNGLGDFYVGNGSYGLSVGVALGGGGAGTTRMWTQNNGVQILGLGVANGDRVLIYENQVTVQGSADTTLSVNSTAGAFSTTLSLLSTSAGSSTILATQYLRFLTGGSERGRFTVDGDFLLGTTSSQIAGYNNFAENSADVQLLLERTGSGAGFGGIGSSGANALNVYQGGSGTLTHRFYVTQAGACYNTTGTYGTISDIKIKENIQDARGYLDDLCRVRVVKYSLKAEAKTAPDKLGVIAQELEQIFPGMIYESPDVVNGKEMAGTTTKTVKYSVFVPMLVKAMQEQQAIIESLKARLDAANL